jgi:hypothetical protein
MPARLVHRGYTTARQEWIRYEGILSYIQYLIDIKLEQNDMFNTAIRLM